MILIVLIWWREREHEEVSLSDNYSIFVFLLRT
jgi:hypothetical protein